MPRSDDRRRQVETTKARYGPDYYIKIGGMRRGSKRQARWASWHRWHKDRFEDGKLKPEWIKEFEREINDSKK